MAVAYVILFLFALPMAGEVVDRELLPAVLNTRLSPLLLLALLATSAVLSLVAWRRGERSTTGRLVLWFSLAGAGLLTLDVLFEALAGR